jgi:recombination protein RecR
MTFSPLIDSMIDALRCLPGVGPKTAQRMAFHLLDHKHREKGSHLAHAIENAMEQVGHCRKCRTFSETELCALCANPRRSQETLCIVETPADILAIEQTGIFQGMYFVLMGHLSPLDGIGPEELRLAELLTRAQQTNPQEIIIATNHTVEGEATAHYIYEMLKHLNIPMTRIAHGVPSGGEIELIDARTLANALADRTQLT